MAGLISVEYDSHDAVMAPFSRARLFATLRCTILPMHCFAFVKRTVFARRKRAMAFCEDDLSFCS